MRSRYLLLTTLFVAGLALPPLFFGVQSTSADMAAIPFVMPLWEQILLFTTAFIIKPLYMALALVIAGLLRRRGEVELVAVRWGMGLFFLGELACALNYLLYQDNSQLLDYLHNYGMVCAFALFAYALVAVLDERSMHYSDREKRCALLTSCGGCYKQNVMDCSLLTLFLYLLPALAAAAAIPLAATLGRRLYIGVVLGAPVLFDHTLASQLIEVRFFPLMAMVFLLFAFALLLIRREEGFGAAKVLVALGLGPLAFSLMRFLLGWGFAGQPHWADIWEELTELMFIIIILRLVLQVRSQSPLNNTEVS